MNSLQKQPQNKSSLGCISALIIGFLTVGVLGAIALPNFLAMATKAKQSEAKQFLSAINRSQESSQREKKTFSHNFAALGVGIKPQTTNYIYFTSGTKTAAYSYAISRNEKLKSYVGAVFLVPAKYEIKTVSILCQAKLKGINRLQEPILQNGVPTCGADSEDMR